MLGFPVLTFHSIRQIRSGKLEQKMFGISYLIYGLLAVTTIAMNLSLMPATLWTAYSSQFGQLVHVLASQLGLYFRLRTRERERNEARVQLELAKRENLYLSRAANTDPLTRLDNRRSFLEQYRQEMERVRRHPAELPSLAIMDLDEFKRVNDNYGYEMGDKVLTQFAQVLNRILRSTDVSARWGGEEFAVLLPQTSLDDALIVLERVRRIFGQDSILSPIAEDTPTITVSIGVTRVSHQDEPVDEALRRADQGLYQAKEAGRNRTCVGADGSEIEPRLAEPFVQRVGQPMTPHHT